MNKTIASCSLIVWAGLCISLVAAAPWTISDSNSFLRGFVNQEFLSFMGVVVTITLASAANLYLALNSLEDRVDRPIFVRTKNHIRHSAYMLIVMLVCAFVLVIVKPLVVCGERSAAAINGAAISVVWISVLILIDLTKAAFNLDPRA